MLRADLHGEIGGFRLDADFAVPPGECLALAGLSGAGKTTLLRMLAGLARPARGRVALDGEVWLDSAQGLDLPPERRACGFVFQDYALFPQMSAWRNVAFGLRVRGRAARRAAAGELLSRFGIADLADARPAELSGGERQRVALARAIAAEPKLLLLDEPLAALDASTRAHAGREIAQTIEELHVPAVIVTHDFMQAALLADRVSVIERGQIVQSGTAGELAAKPATAFIADFTGANVLRGEAHARPDGLTEVALDGGGTIVSTDRARGPAAVYVQPWEIALERAGAPATRGSAQNVLEARVASVTPVGNRVRVGLELPQPAVAEVTAAAVKELALAPGQTVRTAFKASATRVLEA